MSFDPFPVACFIFGRMNREFIFLYRFRFVAVWLPFRAPTICSVARAKLATLVLFILTILYNAHVFWTINLRLVDTRYFCGSSKNLYMRQVFNYVHFASYSVIPFIMVLVLNMCIISRVSRSTPNMQGGMTLKAHEAAVEKLQRQQRVTYMLLTVSFTFLLLTGPFTLHSLIVGDTKDQRAAARNLLSKTICFMLMYANHSINFYLYCITGKKFRNELLALLSMIYHHRRPVPRRSSHRTNRTPPWLNQSPIHGNAIVLQTENKGKGMPHLL